MKSISTHTSILRGLIKEYSRTTEVHTDQFLYELLSISRAEVIKQRLDQFKTISTDNFIRVCFQLEVTKSHNCSCVPDYLNCKVLRTIYKVPSVISARNKSKIELFLLDGTNINLVTEKEWLRIKHNEFKSKFYYASQVNGYIYFWNLPLNLKVVEIYGLWSNVSDLADIPCNDDSGSTTCYNVIDSDFPVDEELSHIMYKKAIELLQIPMQVVQDKTNDNNESIR